MKRGELYRVRRPGDDPKKTRVFVVASRQSLVDSKHSTVVCAPIHTQRLGLSNEVHVGIDEGLLHDSAIRCDSLINNNRSSRPTLQPKDNNPRAGYMASMPL